MDLLLTVDSRMHSWPLFDQGVMAIYRYLRKRVYMHQELFCVDFDQAKRNFCENKLSGTSVRRDN